MIATHPFLDQGLSVDLRVADLVSRLSLDEKISLLMHESPAIERLGVPAYNWWNEACHGVGRNGTATVFPRLLASVQPGTGTLYTRLPMRFQTRQEPSTTQPSLLVGGASTRA